MASTQVAFDIVARNKASREFQQLAGDMEKAAKRGTLFGSAVGSALGGVAKDGVYALGGALRGMIADARESEKIGRLTASTIKATGGAANLTAKQVGDLATRISNKTGADDEAVQSASNLLLTFTKVRDEVGKGNDVFSQATQSATDMAAALGTEPSKAALQLGKALNDPIKGISTLTRSGVSFTAQQKEQVKAMVAAGDTLGAQKVILREVNTEFGGAAKAASDPLDRLKVTVGNLGEQIGSALLPYIDAGATKLGEFVGGLTGEGGLNSRAEQAGEAVRGLGDKLKAGVGFLDQHSTAVKVGATVLGALFAITKIHTAFLAVQAAGGLLKYAASTRIVTALTKTWTAVTWLLTAAQTALTGPIGLTILAVGLLTAGFVIAYKKSETFRDVVNGAWNVVKSGGGKMWGALKPVFVFLLRAWLVTAGGIVDGAAAAFGWVPGIGPKLKEAARKFGTFKAEVNAQLAGLNDKNINVTATARVIQATQRAGREATGRGFTAANGGPIRGPGTGTSDSIPGWLSNGEHVWTAKEVRNAGGHAAVEGMRRQYRFAEGGGVRVNATTPAVGRIIDPLERLVDRVGAQMAARARKLANDTARRMEQESAAPAVSGGGIGWARQMAILHSRFPGLQLISGFRPGARTAGSGAVSYHASGRAVDVPPRWDVFEWLRANYKAQSKEIIFSPANNRQVWNGRDHFFANPRTRADHFNHVHWAMANGGVIREPVAGIGLRTGASYSLGERGPETVVPGVAQRGRGGDTIVHVHVHGSVKTERDLLLGISEGLARMSRQGYSMPLAAVR